MCTRNYTLNSVVLNVGMLSVYHLGLPVAYPGILFGGGGGSTNLFEDWGGGSGGDSPLLRGFGGSCNFVQEISFHIVKCS